jgi:hypothetical protein
LSTASPTAWRLAACSCCPGRACCLRSSGVAVPRAALGCATLLA